MSDDTAEAPTKTIEDVLSALNVHQQNLAKRIDAMVPKLSESALDTVAIIDAAKDARAVHVTSPGKATDRNGYNTSVTAGWVVDIEYGPEPASVVEGLRDEVARFRAHSVLLNTVSWRLHQAMGVIPVGATAYLGDLEADLDRICELIAIGRRTMDASAPTGMSYTGPVQQMTDPYQGGASS